VSSRTPPLTPRMTGPTTRSSRLTVGAPSLGFAGFCVGLGFWLAGVAVVAGVVVAGRLAGWWFDAETLIGSATGPLDHWLTGRWSLGHWFHWLSLGGLR